MYSPDLYFLLLKTKNKMRETFFPANEAVEVYKILISEVPPKQWR